MSTFKITNITNLLGKRESKFNSVLEIEYVDNMMKKIISINPNSTIYLKSPSLPISAHSLRVKNLITVSEVSDTELINIRSKSKSMPEAKPKPETKPIVEIKPVVIFEEPQPKQIKKNTPKDEATT